MEREDEEQKMNETEMDQKSSDNEKPRELPNVDQFNSDEVDVLGNSLSLHIPRYGGTSTDIKESPCESNLNTCDESNKSSQTYFEGNDESEVSENPSQLEDCVNSKETAERCDFNEIKDIQDSRFVYKKNVVNDDEGEAISFREHNSIVGESRNSDQRNEDKNAHRADFFDASKRLFVRPVPIACTAEGLKAFFTEYGLKVNDAYIPVKGNQTRAYGFVGFDGIEDVEKALKLNGAVFNGEVITIARAQGRDTSRANKGCSCLLVKNLPSQTRKEDLELVFPTAVNIRVVMGSPNQCRGMAFLDFDSYESTKAVIENPTDRIVCGNKVELEYAQNKDKKIVGSFRSMCPENPMGGNPFMIHPSYLPRLTHYDSFYQDANYRMNRSSIPPQLIARAPYDCYYPPPPVEYRPPVHFPPMPQDNYPGRMGQRFRMKHYTNDPYPMGRDNIRMNQNNQKFNEPPYWQKKQ